MREATSPISPSPQARPRLLVVDDNDTTRHRLTEILLQDGYHVDEATDGLEALKKVSATRYDGIVLDLVMPHVDGWQFRETALRHPELAQIPTVIVTVRALREQDRYALRTPYIVHKPFDDKTVLFAVARACRRPTDAPEGTATPAKSRAPALYWSKRGDVACAVHAPSASDVRWHEEKWTAIPDGAGRGRITYQCQYCSNLSTPIHHRAIKADSDERR
jgi:two-component system chemotaxis response regulator CheY